MSWQAASFVVLGLVLAAGFAWYERDKPPARVLSLVATLAALAVVGRLAFAAVPNVKPTTDIVLFAGYALGAVPGFAVGAVTALVSNVFLSQGPWTPWQMVGWGAVGVGGALLARTLRGREPSRLLLAAVCGLAGLVFGAWMDLYQLTLAAHQDLSTYLALSATSLPYNLAHALGNVVFCLLIGPVFIRALRRYRRRFEVRWAAPAVAAVLLLLLPAVAAAATPADRAEKWLLSAQNRDGGFGAAAGQSSSELFSGWTGLGLAASGLNAHDVKRRRGRSLAAYLRRNGDAIRDIGEIERTILLLEAAGLSSSDFGGRDLVAEVSSRRRGNGSFAGFVSYTAFGVLALKAAGAEAGERTIRWLLSAQNEDGGFGLTPSSASEADMTGATLQALATVGRAGSPAARRATRWLLSAQNGDGGWGQFEGRGSNAQSTAYAVQGLTAVGGGGIQRALAYLRRLQRSDGSVAYSSSSTQTPVWVTAQALLAFEQAPLPVAEAARQPKPEPEEEEEGDDPAGGGGGTGGGGAAPGGSADGGQDPERDAGGGGGAGDAPSQDSPAGAPGDAAPAPEDDSALEQEESIIVDRSAPTRDPDGPGLPWWLLVAAVVALLVPAFFAREHLQPHVRRLVPRFLRRDDPVA